MASSNKLKIKINNNNDTRLWRYNKVDDFEALQSFISAAWNSKDFIAQYEDDEGDLITIASAQDLREAVDFARSENKKSLKLFVQNNVKQQRSETKQSSLDNEGDNDVDAEAEAAPEPKKEFDSVRAMAFDFLSNAEIIQLLPEFFGAFIAKLLKQGNDLKPEEITKAIYAELKDARFNVITSHSLFQKYYKIAIPYIANRIAFQQSLFPHFKIETIKNWINQLLGLLIQTMQQTAASGNCAFKDVVIDIEYPAMTDSGKVIHFGVECDLCGQYPIIGDRYKCSICEDWDCCSDCEPKHDHPLIKFKKSSKKYGGGSFKGLSEIMKGLAAMEVKEDDDDDEEMVVDCICGSKMQCLKARNAYKRCNTVYCDCCGAQSFNELVYHCPNGYDAVHHKNGYDLCTKCAQKKVVEDEEKEKEKEVVAVQEQEVEKQKEEEVEAEAEVEEEFEYLAQLTQIKQIMAMDGADNDAMIKQMLVEHKGDIARVVPLLLH